MITEACPHCHNTVVGLFNPSNTRKYLTGLLKTGGMKAVLAAVGSVIPGFGTVSGFLAGGAIDLVYGDDAKKFIDKIADKFEDNKVYVFNCPKCGHSWTRKESQLSYSISESVSVSENVSDNKSEFDEDFDDYIEKLDAALTDLAQLEELAADMAFKADFSKDKFVSSKYSYLAGLAYLLCVKENDLNESTTEELLDLADLNLMLANDKFESQEYDLISSAVCCLQQTDPEECADIETIKTEDYEFENPPLFKPEFLFNIYNYCRFISIVNCMDDLDEDDEEDQDLRVRLWKAALPLSDKDYRLVAHWNLFHLLNELNGLTPSGKLHSYSALYLKKALETEGYSIDDCDVDSIYDRCWLSAYVYYACSLVEGTNPYDSQDMEKGLDMLFKAAEKEPCFAQKIACFSLGEYYENGIGVPQDRSMALEYYKKSGNEEEVARLMKESAEATSAGNPNDEAEYIEELKACMEDGEISKGERRLLEKLRVKLGISEIRAAELEASLSEPQLTEEEQEYLNEYQECLAEGGSISAGERRLLDRLRVKLGITEQRAEELENL